MYALKLDDTGRVLSVTFPQYAPESAVIVETIPEGNIYEYRYENGAFVHDPIPQPEPAEREASADEVLNALLGVK